MDATGTAVLTSTSTTFAQEEQHNNHNTRNLPWWFLPAWHWQQSRAHPRRCMQLIATKGLDVTVTINQISLQKKDNERFLAARQSESKGSAKNYKV